MNNDSRIYIGEAADLYYWLDNTFEGLANKKFDTVKAKVPVMINQEEIERLGYNKSFTGHLTKVWPLVSSEEDNCCNYLIPAACLPVYPVVKKYNAIDDKCITFRTPVFRYEEGRRSAFRMWEFSVRELVFIGKKDFVLQSLKVMEELIVEFCIKIKMPVNIKTGSDYFTGDSKKIKVLQKMQKANDLKREMVVICGNEEVALGSINYHADHFSKIYNFDNEATIVSGCIGFGLERWVTACQSLGIKIPCQ